MQVIKKIKEMQAYSDETRARGKIIGFVPTMGYLHEGHLSLVRAAKKDCDVVIVSIFVNPTQFGPNEDYNEYLRDFEHDSALLEKEKADILFYPSVDEMYPEEQLTLVKIDKIAEHLCGISRPTHFQGVATVVSKLFNIAKPRKAYFGQKDYQQCLVIKKMAKDLDFDIDIVTCPTVREKDGIAMSSRNKYLSHEERKSALSLNRSLVMAKKMIENGENDIEKIKRGIKEIIEKEKSAKIDYIEVLNSKNLEKIKKIKGNVIVALAVFIGKTRLIDNMLIEK